MPIHIQDMELNMQDPTYHHGKITAKHTHA